MNSQSFFLSFFIGQDAELSGTLSLFLTQCCKILFRSWPPTTKTSTAAFLGLEKPLIRYGVVRSVWCVLASSTVPMAAFITLAFSLFIRFLSSLLLVIWCYCAPLKVPYCCYFKKQEKPKPFSLYSLFFFLNPFSCVMTTPSVKVSQFPKF